MMMVPRSKSTWIAYAVDIPEEATETVKSFCAAINLRLIAPAPLAHYMIEDIQQAVAQKRRKKVATSLQSEDINLC